MDGVTYAKTQLEQALGLMNTCASGMDDAQYNWHPGGTCNTAAKSHVHALTAIDFFVVASLTGGQMSWGDVAAATGIPANPTEVWNYDGSIPFAPIDEYGKKIQKAALDYVATLKDADLDHEANAGPFGMKSVAFLLQLAGTHAVGHGGDIAAVKGMQGLKGLPF